MKSKVILFCVLLFCSKIVESIPHSEDHVRQRVNLLSNWQVNQNAPNAQYLDTDFTQTRNVNIQPEKTLDFYPNQGRRHNYDTNVYNRSPASSPSGEDLLVSDDYPADGLRLDSYPPRVESYPSRTSQVGFDNQQYRNQNWRQQNQYTKPVPSAVLIPDDERPLVTTGQEPYQGPVQYLQPKYVPSTNRGFYRPGRTYLTREQVQYPLTGDRKYVANSAPRFVSSGSVPYENYGEDQLAASEIKARPTGGRRYAQSTAPQSGIIYDEVPAVIAPGTLTDQSENIEFAENYRSRSVLSNSAPITNKDDRSPLISEPDNNSDSISSNLEQINTKKEAPVIMSKILSERPLARRYANNYRSDSGWSNIVGDDSSNVVNKPVEVKSGKYEGNYGPREPVPISTNSGAPSAPSDTVLVNSGGNKREESNVAHHGSNSPTPTNTNPKQNVYPTISSEGITEYNLNSFVAKPEIQDILAKTNKRYVVVHSNGTVEFLDAIDFSSPENSKLRLVHHKRKNIDGYDSDGVLTQQLPENLPNNIAKAPLSVGEYPLPTNNQPADDKKPTLLNVDQAKPADEYDSNRSPPLEDLPANHSNLKPSPQPEKHPAVKNNYKPSSSPSNGDQSIQNDNLKPLPQGVNQPRDDDDSNTLTPHVNQSAGDGNSKPLPQEGNKPADQKNRSADDDNLKPLTLKEEPTKDRNNFTPLFPNARQPTHVKKPNSYVKHPAKDNNSEPLPANENQPRDDKPFHPYRRHPAYNHKSKYSHVNEPADNNNSNPSSPGESQPTNDSNSWPSNENQLGGETDSTSLLPHKHHPVHRYKPKSRHSHNQPADDNPSTTPNLLTYPENQKGGDTKSNPSSPGENQPASDNNSWPSNEDQSGDETDSTSLLSHKKQPSHHYEPKSRHPYNQPADDNTSTTPKLLTYPKNPPGDDKNSNPSAPNENEPENNDSSESWLSNEDESEGETDSTSLPSHKNDQPANNNTSNPSSTPLLNYPENQPGDDDNSNPSSPSEDQAGDDNSSKQLPPNEDQSGGGNDSGPLPTNATLPENNTKSEPIYGAPSGNDNNSNPSSPDENQPEEDEKLKPLRPNENQSTDDLKTIPTSADASKNDDQSNSTTVSPTEPNYTTSSKPEVIKTHKRKHIHRTSTTNSPVISTTPCPDDTSEDQIITLSPIEQTTDNVSDVPPVVTTTTTTRPVKTPSKSDNDANNKQDDAQDDIAQTYSTTTAFPSTSTSPPENISDDKTKGTKENENTQTKDKTNVDQVNNREKDTQTAVYNSSELLDTNIDVPAESDDYLSVTASPSVQNDVDTGDASDNNSLELEQSETDVTITVSGSTANDSEDEMITINIEVSESTDDADSSSTENSLVVSIDTDDGNDDDSKTPKPEDCKKDHNNDGRGKNVEIDMSNLKGEPTMWIRTTNQDFVDKLMAKNDTEFDLIYFFHIDNQPAVEREKTTTIHCNGTVVTEIIEITYANKDDLTPTIVKTTKITDLEHYKADEV